MDGAHITGIDGIQVVIIGGPGHAGEDHGYGRLLFLSTDFSSTGFRSLVLEAVMKILKWRARPISVFSGNYIYLITPDEVRYVESDRRTLHIHASSLIDTYATITQFRELVPSHFIQCHKSYLVNIDFIKAFTGDRIILLTGESVPVSQRRKHAVREQILRFSKGL